MGLIDQIQNTTSWFSISGDIELQAISYSFDDVELRLLLEILQENGFIEGKNGSGRLTARGFVHVEGIGIAGQISNQAFVAMSFDPSMDDNFTQGFDRAIRSVGYVPMRIDRKEHVNGISDEILSEIRRSKFLIADYTHMNSGVYFEAGFAMGLGIPVIPTCQSGFVDKLHFDIRHINTLIWNGPSDLAALLATRISAVIGDGLLVQSSRTG